MGEISFQYKPKAKFNKISKFRYTFAESTEYGFDYERCISLLNAQMLYGPAAIEKVAAGLIRLEDIVVSKLSYIINIPDNDIFISEHSKLNINKSFTLLRSSYSFDKKEWQQIYKQNYYKLNLYSNIMTSTNILFLNYNEQIFVERIKNNRFYKFRNDYLKSNIIEVNYPYYMILAKNYNNVLNAFKQNRLLLNTLILNRNDNDFNVSNRYDNILNYNKDYMLSNRYLINANIIKNINCYKVFTGKTLINKTMFLYKILPELNIFDNISMHTRLSVKNIQIDKNINSFRNKYYATINGIYFCRDFTKYLNIFNIDILASKEFLRNNYMPGSKYSIKHNILLSYTNKILQSKLTFKNLKYFNNFIFYNKINSNLSYHKDINFEKIQNSFSYANTLVFGNIIQKNIFTSKEKSLKIFSKDIMYHNYYNPIYWISKKPSDSDITDTTVSINKNKSYIYTSENVLVTKNFLDLQLIDTSLFISKNNKDIFLTNHIFIKNYQKLSKIIDKKDIYISKNECPFSFYKSLSQWITKKEHLMNIDKNKVFINKNKKTLNNAMQPFSMFKLKYNINIYEDLINITKTKYPMNILNLLIKMTKDKKSFIQANYGFSIFKDRKSFINKNNGFAINKIKKDFKITNNGQSIYKYPHVLNNKIDFGSVIYRKSYDLNNLVKEYFLLKNSKDFKIFEFTTNIFKSYQKTMISDNDINHILKHWYLLDLLNIISQGYAGMIIPLSKIPDDTFIDDINLMLQKIKPEVFIPENVAVSLFPKNTTIMFPPLMCDKESNDVMISYKNIIISKQLLKANIDKGFFINKASHNAYIYNQYWTSKNDKKAYIDKNKFVSKNHHYLDINKTLFVVQGAKELYSFKQMFVDKEDKICYYDYGIHNSIFKDPKKLYINKQLPANKQDNYTRIFNTVLSTNKKMTAFIKEGILASSTIVNCDLCNHLIETERTLKEASIFPNDFGNWAWVYETPDPFEGDTFGIDELLLPERDTRYKDFNKIIFNEETMTPRNPVKVINETSFIAKYPTKHPVPDYEDIGIVYLDVRTEIMHEIYLKFYQIWQTKIFEFSTMTMTQSVKLMLDYTYSWIMTYYNAEDLPEALRVFRQIRWFAETSIIQNSQYIIDYEYDVLSSDLNTGICHIPNDLDGQNNDTMYVDASLGVLRNTYWNNGIGAYVTFEINNKKNSQIKFSLSNGAGSVNIYINDVLVDIITSLGMKTYSYDLPYHGETNYVKIEKLPAHNINNKFFIGNIKIPNASFKNLNISFDPKLKAGNKPLSEIAKKMIAYANLYDNRNEIYAILRKGNLGVSEMYKRMDEYWKLHHENKTKGKRLTIKEV